MIKAVKEFFSTPGFKSSEGKLTSLAVAAYTGLHLGEAWGWVPAGTADKIKDVMWAALGYAGARTVAKAAGSFSNTRTKRGGK